GSTTSTATDSPLPSTPPPPPLVPPGDAIHPRRRLAGQQPVGLLPSALPPVPAARLCRRVNGLPAPSRNEPRRPALRSDVTDVEGWLRTRLAAELEDVRVHVDAAQLIVVGASAGAHLALLTPKLWTVAPKAILSMYGPTNLHHLPADKTRLTSPQVPCTADVLAAATTYENPPTDIPLPRSAKDCIRPRQIMAMNVFQRGVVAEFVLQGLVRLDDGSLSLPAPGCVSKEEVDAISPLHLCTFITYPPVYQVMGAADDTFDTSHVHSFHDALLAQGCWALYLDIVVFSQRGGGCPLCPAR
ncbi:polyketide synthase, partial [Diplocarpon rosae]